MKRKLILSLALTLLILLYSFSVDSEVAAKTTKITVLQGGTLIDGTGKEPITEAMVVLQGDRILAADKESKLEIPSNAKIINTKGLYLLPGLINSHIHKGLDKQKLRAWISGGVTTVRDIGSSIQDLNNFRKSHEDSPKYARLVAAGPLVTVPGGYPIVPWGSIGIALTVSSPLDAKNKIEQLLDGNSDVIKIAIDSGVIFQGTIPILSSEEASMIVRIAHARGTVVSAHATAVRDLIKALDAGVDDIAHMVVDVTVPDSLIKRIVNEGVYWVPTLELWRRVGFNLDTVATNNLNRFVNSGGKVALGTDYAGYAAAFDLGTPITEITMMKEAGMTPMQIIMAATKHAAIVCNRGKDLGTIEKGKIADILIISENPIADIQNLSKIRMVFRDGKAAFRKKIEIN